MICYRSLLIAKQWVLWTITKILLSLPPNQISDAVIALNEDLLAIARWCCTNSPVINPDKTKLLVIGVPQITRNLPSFSPVKLLGKKFKPVLVAKDLGVIIDSSLSYNEHVTKTVSDCRHRLIRINRIKHLDRKTLLLLIDASVFSKLFYCSIVWSNTSKTNEKNCNYFRTLPAGQFLVSGSMITLSHLDGFLYCW